MPHDNRRWSTDDQRTWLQAQMPAYMEAQKLNRFDAFWPKLNSEWFALYPERAPTDADLSDVPEVDSGADALRNSPVEEASVMTVSAKRKRKAEVAKVKKRAKQVTADALLNREDKIKGRFIRKRKEQLQNYFRYNSPTVQKAVRSRKPQAVSHVFDTFGQSTADKSGRAPQETEIYLKLYNDTRISHRVKQRALELNHKGPMINIIRDVTREMWEDEDDETRDLVAKELAVQLKLREDEQEAAAEMDGQDPTPQQYQDSIDHLPQYMDDVLKQVTRYTGFSATLIMGGPVPAHNGSISTVSYHIGKDEYGSTFGVAHPDYKSEFVRPFTDFLRTVYSPDVRAARALNASPSGSGQPSLCSHGTETMDIDIDIDQCIPSSISEVPLLPTSATPAGLPVDVPSALTPFAPAPSPAHKPPVAAITVSGPSPTPARGKVTANTLLSPPQAAGTAPMSAHTTAPATTPSTACTIPVCAPKPIPNPSPRLNRIAQNKSAPGDDPEASEEHPPRPKPRATYRSALKERAQAEANVLKRVDAEALLSKLVEAPAPATNTPSNMAPPAIESVLPPATTPADCINSFPPVSSSATCNPFPQHPSGPGLSTSPEMPIDPNALGAAAAATTVVTDSARPRRTITQTPAAAELAREKLAKAEAAAKAAGKRAAKKAGSNAGPKGGKKGRAGAAQKAGASVNKKKN